MLIGLALTVPLAVAGFVAARLVGRPRDVALAGLFPAGVLALALRAAMPSGSLLALEVAFVMFVGGVAYAGWLVGVRWGSRAARPAGRVALLLCGLAIMWAVALVGAAFTAPAYSGMRCTAEAGSSGVPGQERCFETTATLIEVNGAGALVPLAIPLAAAVAVTLLLSLHCRRGSWAAMTGATTVIVLLFGFGFVTGFSIGLYVLPLVPLLAVAALLTPTPQRRSTVLA